jgi:ribosome recycling factor
MDEITKAAEEKMKKTLESLKKDFAAIRTGRASPSLLDHINVEYYGTVVPLKQLANISVPEPRQLTIHPYDKNSVKEIEKALQKSDLGLNPNSEGGLIRLNMPQPTQERRNDLVKIVKKEAENSKVSLRNIRKDFITEIKTRSESEKWSEDRKKKEEEEVQAITNKYTVEIDKLSAAKEIEILAI